MRTTSVIGALRLILTAAFFTATASAQQYDFPLSGGRVVDPGDGVNALMDVAVTRDRIAAVEPNIPASQARKVVDVSGLYVVPGLVDLHMHVFGYAGAIPPDTNALPAGTTTIVDVGGSGWRTFDRFKSTVISSSQTRVLVLLNIVSKGMIGEPYESNTEDMDPAKEDDESAWMEVLHSKDLVSGRRWPLCDALRRHLGRNLGGEVLRGDI